MNPQILHECTALAFQNKITFPETVKRLAETGVERYCADLVKLEKFYHSLEGSSHVEPLPLTNAPKIHKAFSSQGVKDAIAAIHQGRINYPEFLRRIMAAGVVYYDVFLRGRRIIYTGRDGDFHVEDFPKK